MSKTTNNEFDIRLIDYNLYNGKIDKKKLDKHLASLPDSADKLEYVDMNEEPASEEIDDMPTSDLAFS